MDKILPGLARAMERSLAKQWQGLPGLARAMERTKYYLV